MKDYKELKQPIKTIFTDIDDTLTTDGRLPSSSYEMLWKLFDAGFSIIPVTGRPAGWCEMIARMWPVTAVIGENGAFYFQYKDKQMKRVFATAEDVRLENQKKLKVIEEEVFKQIPNAGLASDQFTRLFDLAIDFCEDVAPLPQSDIEKIVKTFTKYGAQAKVSSIHVNGWFGDYNKRSMCEIYYKNEFGKELESNMESCAFVGDSPNDEPLFGFFQNSFAVGNIMNFVDQLKEKPKYIMPGHGAHGFVELGNHLLSL